MGIGRVVRRAVRRVARIGGSIVKAGLNIMKSKLSSLMSLAQGPLAMATGLLNKIPGGRLIAGMASKFFSSPLAMLAGGPIAMFGMMALKSALGGNLSQTVNQTANACGGHQNMHPQAHANMVQITAYSQAQVIAGRYC